MILKSKNQSASSSILKQGKGSDRQPPLPPFPHTPLTPAPPPHFSGTLEDGGNKGVYMGGFFHRRRFALSVYEVALIDAPPAPTAHPPRECQSGKKKKRKAIDMWIIKKQIIHISTATTATAATTVYIPCQCPCFITSRPPHAPPTAPKFKKNIKKSNNFRGNFN